MINLTLENNLICIKFDYDPGLVTVIKAIPSARWDKSGKQWIVSQYSWRYVYNIFHGRSDVIASPELRDLIIQKEAALEKIENLKTRKDYPFLSYKYASKLYPYQRVGVKFLSLPGNKFLADEMGCISGDACIVHFQDNNIIYCGLKSLYKKFTDPERKSDIFTYSSLGKKSPSLFVNFILNKIENIVYKGFKRVVELTLKSGKTLELTPDHKVYTFRRNIDITVEWRPVSDLKKDDIVYTRDNLMVVCDEVVCIQKLKQKKEVYDLVMADPFRNFVANGITVHNCGKTPQSIATAEEIGARKILVVCPNALKYNWLEEVGKWSDQPAIVLPSKIPTKRKEKILEEYKLGYFILNYEAVRGRYLDYLVARTWDLLIFDESTKIKNLEAQVTKNCAKLVAKKIIPLSGAPITRNAADLFSQLAIIYPEKYFSYWKFADKFCEIQTNRFGKQATGCKSFEALKSDIFEFTIRRTKKEVKPDLPDKIKQTIKLENMVPRQAKIYQIIRDQILEEIEAEQEDKLKAPFVITKFLRLAQTTSTTANLGYEDYSAKLDYLEEIIEERYEDHKICIWCNFRPTISCMESRLKDYNFVTIHGDIDAYQRQQNIYKFNKDESCRIFISTLSSGKYGFNLVPEKDENILVIYVDKNFNFDDQVQSEARTHRITTRVPPEYLSLVQKSTIDEYIAYNLKEKGKILAGVFGVDKPITLRKKEIMNIIKHPEKIKK